MGDTDPRHLHGPVDRRRFLAYFSATGFSSTLFPGVLYAMAQEKQALSKEIIAQAEKVAGLEFTDAERELMLNGLNELTNDYAALRKLPLDNSVPPALTFEPLLPGMEVQDGSKQSRLKMSRGPTPERSADLEELAFLPVTHLSRLIRKRKVSSVELTEMYLARLQRYDPVLHCVITLTGERALEQAWRADKEIAAGYYRGPLHGIPWGAKDLLATRGIPTTWGAVPYKDQVIDTDATVVERLEQAGAVLVAKLTLGALAWGDVWFGGMTRSPWNPEKGSSGSSAGSAAATAAGLVGFAIGSETYGSIVSPCTACGVTGLRPTFGRVSRYGAMALSWSMDKLGPICRSVEDCALVLHAVCGPDGRDGTVANVPFRWDASLKLSELRIGYLKSAFDEERDQKAIDDGVLETLLELGIELVPIELPDYPVGALSFILSAEAAAAFDELTRSGRDDLLVRQVEQAWPNVFRQARLIPAVEYIQANRARTLLMQAMAELMQDIDVYVAPSFSSNLLLTNLTGHPAVVVPNGFDGEGMPTTITFTGRLYGEAELLAVARAYQDATDHHLKHPRLKDQEGLKTED